eukprot:TRINITY_DN2905_c0_g1_i17.p2 TRINITY_DN2905_c0_g1~~TRINITY_DN2905_c0_g1_i17.p2  ORF type:complete len:107 (-),score=0.87 TRINITY_DN2905_c0_g1_i17:70-390(-)
MREKYSMYDAKKEKKIGSFYMYEKLDRENVCRQGQILCKNFLICRQGQIVQEFYINIVVFYMYEILDSDKICRQGQIVQEFYINIFQILGVNFLNSKQKNQQLLYL